MAKRSKKIKACPYTSEKQTNWGGKTDLKINI